MIRLWPLNSDFAGWSDLTFGRFCFDGPDVVASPRPSQKQCEHNCELEFPRKASLCCYLLIML